MMDLLNRSTNLALRFFSSAGLIFLFYLVFYVFLAGLFTLTMYVMLQTLEEHKPTWQDRLTTPGAVARETVCTATREPRCQRLPVVHRHGDQAQVRRHL